ncbi:MAG: N-acetyltransferase family protein [Casimicrobiaceae bacterium]
MGGDAASIVVRAAAADDLPAIAAIYAQHVALGTASFELEPPGVEEMQRRHAAAQEGGYPYFVAADVAGRVIGYAYAGPYRSRPAYRHTVEDSVYVEPGGAGHGVGSALLAVLVAACADRGFRQMIAIIGGADNAASIGLHRSHGFVEAGRLGNVGRKHDRWLDTVLMQRALGDGGESPPTRD